MDTVTHGLLDSFSFLFLLFFFSLNLPLLVKFSLTVSLILTDLWGSGLSLLSARLFVYCFVVGGGGVYLHDRRKPAPCPPLHLSTYQVCTSS